ncbi:MAG: hypothetical protein WC055_09705 [Melioribacteraceae bacterium]
MNICQKCGNKNLVSAQDAFEYFNSGLKKEHGESGYSNKTNSDSNLTYPDNPDSIALSESIDPPIIQSNSYGILGFIVSLFVAVVSIVLSFFYGDVYIYIGILFTALAIFFHYLETKLSEKQSALLEKEKEEYKKKFVCLSCGQVFTPIH